MARSKQFWLLKTEPTSFSILDLARSPGQTTCWDGVRNYQARNYLREMKLAERVLFYHSQDDRAITGTAEVVREAYPDHTAWEQGHEHFDPKSSPENPIWFMVDIRLVGIFHTPLNLDELRKVSALRGMELLRQGSRLSVQPVTKAEYEAVVALAKKLERTSSKTGGTSPQRRSKA
jgi:predicted RNA-binding protein with PUA-like domain